MSFWGAVLSRWRGETKLQSGIQVPPRLTGAKACVDELDDFDTIVYRRELGVDHRLPVELRGNRIGDVGCMRTNISDTACRSTF